MFLFNKYNSESARNTLTNGINELIHNANRSANRKEDCSYIREISDLKDNLQYVEFNETSYKALKNTIVEYASKGKLSRSTCETFLRRAKASCSLKRGQTLPNLTTLEQFDQMLDLYEDRIADKSSRIQRLEKQCDHYLDTNDELAWNRANGELSVLKSEANRIINLYNVTSTKKTNVAESLLASTLNIDYIALAEKAEGTVDVDQYEDNLAAQRDISKEIIDEANQMASINNAFSDNPGGSFAEAKAAREEKLHRDSAEFEALIEEVEDKTKLKNGTKI